MNNITKYMQTILFVSLIAVMILPFSGGSSMQSVEAVKEPYTLSEIDRAFTNSEGYVTYDDHINQYRFSL